MLRRLLGRIVTRGYVVIITKGYVMIRIYCDDDRILHHNYDDNRNMGQPYLIFIRSQSSCLIKT